MSDLDGNPSLKTALGVVFLPMALGVLVFAGPRVLLLKEAHDNGIRNQEKEAAMAVFADSKRDVTLDKDLEIMIYKGEKYFVRWGSKDIQMTPLTKNQKERTFYHWVGSELREVWEDTVEVGSPIATVFEDYFSRHGQPALNR